MSTPPALPHLQELQRALDVLHEEIKSSFAAGDLPASLEAMAQWGVIRDEIAIVAKTVERQKLHAEWEGVSGNQPG